LPISAARVVACKVLLRLARDENAFAAETLDEQIVGAACSDADARLASAIVYNTLRNAYLLDLQYRPFLKQAPSRLSEGLQILFRMAACQRLLLSRIPAHAIANDTVELARRVLRLPQREVSFANAIVRKIAALGLLSYPPQDDPRYLTVRYSTSEWLLDLFRKKYGEPNLLPLLEALNQEPELTLRISAAPGARDAVLQRVSALGGESAPGSLSPSALVVTGVPLARLLDTPEFRDGHFYLQDEGSQLVSWLAAPQPGETILDLCAAPGGKTTHMADLAGGAARIVATDVSERRLANLRENLSRLRTVGVEVVPYEEVTSGAAGHFDCVLVDAPCSGLGTIRRNPEIRYRCSAGEIERLAAQQLDILTRAGALVRPGGRLVYSTCTFTDEENRGVIAKFLEQAPGLTIVESPSLPAPIAALRTPGGYYATWPHHHQVDGFEAVVLRRALL